MWRTVVTGLFVLFDLLRLFGPRAKACCRATETRHLSHSFGWAHVKVMPAMLIACAGWPAHCAMCQWQCPLGRRTQQNLAWTRTCKLKPAVQLQIAANLHAPPSHAHATVQSSTCAHDLLAQRPLACKCPRDAAQPHSNTALHTPSGRAMFKLH
jgi:hypothetical protein